MTDSNLPGPVVITRTFDAPRELVFAAMNEPAHMERWWGPHHFTTHSVSADLRPGGSIRFAMRGPDGNDHWCSGVYEEYTPTTWTVVTSWVEGPNGEHLFDVHTTITYEVVGDKTELTLTARVVALSDPAMAPAIAGMEEGWNQSFKKLASHLGEVQIS